MGFTIQPLQQAINNIPLYIRRTYRYNSATEVLFFQMEIDFTSINVLHVTFTHRCDAGNCAVNCYIDSTSKFTTGGQVDGTEGYWAIDTSGITGVHTFKLYIYGGGGATSEWTDDLCVFQKL